jgi:two-component system nitrogen regulation response regulator NtrX
MPADILVVDDEADIRDIVSGILEDEGYGTRTAGDSDSALAAIGARRPNLVFLDIWLQGSRLDGLSMLDEIHRHHPDLPVVIISGHGNVETAVSAIKRGAYDYIEKPFKADRLVLVAARALEASNLRREVAELKQRSGESEELIGSSAVMSHLRQTLERIAPTNSRIMIFGPSGSGKEQVARTIHALSNRPKGPLSCSMRRRSRRTVWKSSCSAPSRGTAPRARRRTGGGARRHDLPRRDRRHAARNAEQDPARAGGPDL